MKRGKDIDAIVNESINNKDIFIMPFAPKSILTCFMLKNCGINVSGFCDNDKNLESKDYEGLPIRSPVEVFKSKSDATIILSERLYYTSNEEQLQKLGFNSIISIDELSFDDDLEDFIPVLNEESYSDLIPKQIGKGRQLLRMMSTLRTWDALLTGFRDEHVEPYSFIERDTTLLSLESHDVRFVVCINASGYLVSEFFDQCMSSLSEQKYTDAHCLVVATVENEATLKQKLKNYKCLNITFIITPATITNVESISQARCSFSEYMEYEYIITLGANDTYSKNTLNIFADAIRSYKSFHHFTANEDRLYKGEYISPFYKNEYKKLKAADAVTLMRNVICTRTSNNESVSSIDIDDICVIDDVLYHYRVLDGVSQDNGIKPIAFYLPQFHAIPENDEWWGKGFTEWTNVKRAVPMFEGHYQPHVPGELGHYDLIKDADIQKRQQDLARKYGIFGFCYYFYWFNGKRLLEKPLDNVLANPDLDMPFCICWANENWTRRWDGREHELLMGQEHSDESDTKFLLDVLQILTDPRYITVDGAPLLLVYRWDLFPDFRKTVSRWREVSAQNGVPNLHISMVQTQWYAQSEFIDFGCDSETEFPPWRASTAKVPKDSIVAESGYSGMVFDYRSYISQSMNLRHSPQTFFRGIMVGFDNTPRRMGNASVYHYSSPEEYKKLMISLVDYTAMRSDEERLIFINAWNEWAEGNHLEPDAKYGDAYLKATSEAIRINC